MKNGDTIVYHPGFGRDPPCLAVIEHMWLSKRPGQKYGGIKKSHIPDDIIASGRAVLGLENGHWCYADQVDLETTHKLHELMQTKDEDLPLHLHVHPCLDEYIERRLQK